MGREKGGEAQLTRAGGRYILQSPNCWHLFKNPQYPVYHGRARFEEAEAPGAAAT